MIKGNETTAQSKWNDQKICNKFDLQISNFFFSFEALKKQKLILNYTQDMTIIQNINYIKIRDIKNYLKTCSENELILNIEKKFNINDEELKELFSMIEINPLKIHELNLEGNSLTNKCSQTISNFIEQASNLKKLNLRKNKLEDEGIIRIFTKNNKSKSFLPNLEVLYLGYNNIIGNSIIKLAENFLFFQNVKVLKLEKCIFSYSTMKKFMQYIGHLEKNLRILSLKLCNVGDDDIINVFSEFLRKMSFLSEFDLSFNNIRYISSIKLFVELGCMKDLVYINLSNNEISEKGAEYFSNCFEKLRRLEYINLDHNHILEFGAICISKNLKYLSNLKVLRLNDNKIGNRGLKELGINLKYISNIEEFYLDSNQIKSEGIQSFVSRIRNLNYLKVISLKSNFICSGGASAFATLFNTKYLNSLECLNLNENALKSKDISVIIQSLKGHTRIKNLDFDRNNLMRFDLSKCMDILMSCENLKNISVFNKTIPINN